MASMDKNDTTTTNSKDSGVVSDDNTGILEDDNEKDTDTAESTQAQEGENEEEDVVPDKIYHEDDNGVIYYQDKEGRIYSIGEDGVYYFQDENGQTYFYGEDGTAYYQDQNGQTYVVGEDGQAYYTDESGRTYFYGEDGQNFYTDTETGQIYFYGEDEQTQYFQDEEANTYYIGDDGEPVYVNYEDVKKKIDMEVDIDADAETDIDLQQQQEDVAQVSEGDDDQINYQDWQEGQEDAQEAGEPIDPQQLEDDNAVDINYQDWEESEDPNRSLTSVKEEEEEDESENAEEAQGDLVAEQPHPELIPEQQMMEPMETLQETSERDSEMGVSERSAQRFMTQQAQAQRAAPPVTTDETTKLSPAPEITEAGSSPRNPETFDDEDIRTGSPGGQVNNNNATDIELGGKRQEEAKDDVSSLGEDEKRKKKSEHKEKNAKFKDVEETGHWGGISIVEKSIIGVLLVVVVIIVLVFVIRRANRKPPEPVYTYETRAPTMAPVGPSSQFKLDQLISDIESNPLLSSDSSIYPSSPAFYRYLSTSDNAPSYQRAVSWLLFTDLVEDESQWITRFGLASFYYSTKGQHWKNSTNWMDPYVHHCDWYGVVCDRIREGILEIVLDNNHLQGMLPMELALFNDMIAISLKQNQIGGPISGELFSNSFPQLVGLYLNFNQFTGILPDDILENGKPLQQLRLEQNNITGEVPSAYCGKGNFGVDCLKVSCGCCLEKNCFD